MKKQLFAIALLSGMIANVSAQKYLGLSNSNYSGVYGTQYNPAKAASEKVKLSFNLVSINALIDNDYYKFKGVNAFNNFDFNNIGKSAVYDANQTTMNLLTVGEVLGPSVQFTTSDRLGFGVSTRFRLFGQGHQLDTSLMRALENNIGTNAVLSSSSVFGVSTNTISDLGVSGAYAVVDNEQLRLTLGASVKMYKNAVFNSFTSRGYNMNYFLNPVTNNSYLNVSDVDWELLTSLQNGEKIEDSFNSVSNVFNSMFGSSNAGTGFGGDIGFEASLKDNTQNKPYLLKFGAAVHDIGKIKNKNLQRMHISGSAMALDPTRIDFTDLNATANYLESQGLTVTRTSNTTLSTNLPTNLDLYVDYPINDKFFVSANGLVNLTDKNTYNPYYYNFASLVPRYESKWIDVSVPLTYNFTSQDFKPGLALRLGPLSVGSDDLKILFGNAKGANVYAGLGFILTKKNKEALPKDRDGDGVLDTEDHCPDVAGPAENNGCPWPDTDGDGVIDRDDKCPNEYGAVENNGCPWPDTDGDGIVDKDDKCPNLPGLKEYDGCPKPKEVIAVEATGALKDIIFDFNKASISSASNQKLDQAAEIIKSAQDGTFLVTGHTDKKGNDAYNLKLSRERAAAVVKALEARGVSESQLKSVGVGERDATVPESASDAERAKDRKVVVEAVNASAWQALKKSDLPVVKKKTVSKKAPAKKK